MSKKSRRQQMSKTPSQRRRTLSLDDFKQEWHEANPNVSPKATPKPTSAQPPTKPRSQQSYSYGRANVLPGLKLDQRRTKTKSESFCLADSAASHQYHNGYDIQVPSKNRNDRVLSLHETEVLCRIATEQIQREGCPAHLDFQVKFIPKLDPYAKPMSAPVLSISRGRPSSVSVRDLDNLTLTTITYYSLDWLTAEYLGTSHGNYVQVSALPTCSWQSGPSMYQNGWLRGACLPLSSGAFIISYFGMHKGNATPAIARVLAATMTALSVFGARRDECTGPISSFDNPAKDSAIHEALSALKTQRFPEVLDWKDWCVDILDPAPEHRFWLL